MNATWEQMRKLGYEGIYRLKHDRTYSMCGADGWYNKVDPEYRKGTIVKVVKYKPHDGGQFILANGMWFKRSMLEPVGRVCGCQ